MNNSIFEVRLQISLLIFRITLTIPTCLSMVKILFPVPGSYNFDVTNFSTPNITPSLHLTATAVLNVKDINKWKCLLNLVI